MFKRIGLALLISASCSLPCLAQDGGGIASGPVLYTAQAVLLLLGMGFAAYWAYQAFDTPPIELGGGPALPRYMTQPGQYRAGVIAYVAICLIIYSLIAYFHKPLLPLVDTVAPGLRQTIENSMSDGTLPYPLIIIFSAWVFVILLRIEKDWNPLYALRGIVHGWVSIPQLAISLMERTSNSLVVPAVERPLVAANPDTPFVTVGDFDKDRHSLDRQWAELCYIRFWLERNRAQGSHFTFFSEPSFAWNNLDSDYTNARQRVAPLKRGEVTDATVFADVAAKVELLRRQYCRLAACFLVFKNATRRDALRDAREFGAPISDDPSRSNPLRYLVIFFVAIIFSVNLGVWPSAAIWDSAHGFSVLNQDPTLVVRWTAYALAAYGAPILVVLLLRYVGWTNDQSQPNSYLISYAAIFLVALCVSDICLASTVKLLHGDPRNFPDIIVAMMQWSFSPALICVYVAFHVDRQIDPLLPDIGSSGGQFWRLVGCVLLALLFASFTALPALSIPPTSPPSVWPVEKLRAVIIGTSFIVALVMTLAGEFALVKPTRATDPSGAAAAPGALPAPH